MHPTATSCPNCDTALTEAQRFCGHCGQAAHLHRFTVGHAGHELFHAVTHADTGVFHLTKALATRPGVVAREYILENKRKRYFNPFTYLLLVLGLSLLVYSFVQPYTRPSAAARASTSATVAPAASPTNPFRARQKNVNAFLEKNSKLILLFAIPIMSLVFWLFYIRSGLTYAEHVVANVFFAGFYMLFTSLVLVPLVSIPGLALRPHLNSMQLAFHGGYIAYAYHGFMNYRRPVLYLRTALATALGLLAWALFSGGLIFLYIYYGG